ncbi:AcrR family transcriptional regulator [Microbacterium terrae]|uniref:HTH-type transcriptional regulator YfiR n=1 Tax=Microbacterium terrae TaxID=69369 RepID=A0A0M2HF27_9MICO|nr:TetR/AcrR family transcriptional regulator [Microbacterium terrae]KJL43326.1 putative HTH-type transcriptional regulator YfiR [Microbacterium terrae]MBP1078469.1 AcrR family transcriptional regulator [Microbacterium terrae]GLJ97870.1 TetR family transcriptional regulator [Microbacterium terrae]
MPKISDAKRESRRLEIADAAVRCFLRTGYQRTSMADIIAESGLSAGAIYGYFPGKQELLRFVAERILDDRRAELAAAGAAHPLPPSQIVRLLAEGARANAPVEVLIQVWGEATVDPDLRGMVQMVLARIREGVVAALTQWAEHARADQSPPPAEWARRVAPVIMSMLPGFILQSTLIDDFDEAAYLDSLALALP